MRPCLMISLLLLLVTSTLIHEAQGIRLMKRVSLSGTNPKFHVHDDEGATVLGRRRGVAGDEEINSSPQKCQKEKCSASSGRHRKLVPKTTSSSSITITSKNNKNEGNNADPKLEVESPRNSDQTVQLGRKEEDLLVISSSSTAVTNKNGGQHEKSIGGGGATHHEEYEDVADIAEMDYSPAKRKPPIHN